MIRKPTNRAPFHPGVLLKDLYLDEMGISQADFARHLGCTASKVNEIIRGKRGITPAMAIDLGAAFGTEPEFWLRAQMEWDLYEESKKHSRALAPISAKPRATAQDSENTRRRA